MNKYIIYSAHKLLVRVISDAFLSAVGVELTDKWLNEFMPRFHFAIFKLFILLRCIFIFWHWLTDLLESLKVLCVLNFFDPPAASLGDARALFVHNWRCGGSSFSSLLSANFGENYVKVGTQFTDIGWPDYEVQEVLTVQQVRNKYVDGGILGGHLCVGIESILGGNWDVWMNARQPEKRLSSGIMRFYKSSFRLSQGEHSPSEMVHIAEQRLGGLASGELMHEVNGVAKRLAGFAVADSIKIQPDADLEAISCFFTSVSDDVLFDAALRQMENVKALILPDYMHASIIAIERMYSLGPMINLFSTLRHNPVSLAKPTRQEQALFEFASPLLKKICEVDRRLWTHIEGKFQSQINACCVSKRDVAIREVLHQRPIFSQKLLDSIFSVDGFIKITAKSLAVISKPHPEISCEIVDTACMWSRFDSDVAEEIRAQAHHYLRMA